MSIIGAALLGRSEISPKLIAFCEGERRLTFGALPAAVDGMAAKIMAADPSRQPVGIALANGIDWVLADLALAELGRAAVPLPPFFAPAQAEAALADAGASSIIEAAGVRRLNNLPAALPPGTAKISYTSGSTGSPKGICLSQVQMLDTARAVVDRLGADRADRHLPLLPLGVLLENVAGLYAGLVAGGTYLAEDAARLGLAMPFRPDFGMMVASLDRLGATSTILVPELLRGLVDFLETTGARLPSLRLVAVGGAPVPVSLLERATAVGLPVIQGYGLTECGSVVAMERPGEPLRGTVGRPLDHVRVTVGPAGEILIAGNGHLGMVGAPREPGVIGTGDIGAIDDSGRLTVTGRRSNLIITSFGRNISPEWIEAELTAQPEIAQAMVLGDSEAMLTALIVPAAVTVDPSPALARVNAALPDYARIGCWELSPPFRPDDGTSTSNGRLRRREILARRAALPFFDQLTLATAEHRGRVLAVPQLQAGLRGDISRATYIAYLTQAYHHVRHTVPLMQAARRRLSDRPELIAALDEYIAEETGHDQWILDDIAAAGGDPEDVVLEGPSPATAAMVSHGYLTVTQGNPVAIFGMVFVLEGTSIAIARRGAEAVQRSLGLPHEAFRYLASHGAIDEAHMAFLERLLNAFDNTADRAAVMTVAREIFDLFADVFANIPMDQVHERA